MAVFILAVWRGMYQGLDGGKAGSSPPERVVAYIVTGPETALEEPAEAGRHSSNGVSPNGTSCPRRGSIRCGTFK